MLHRTKRRIHFLRGQFRTVHHKALVLSPAKTIYIPIPKAANSSITLALYSALNMPTPSIEVMRRDKNLTYTPMKKALQLAGPDWFVFSVVRNPIERSKSAHRDKVQSRDPIFRPCATMGIQPEDGYEAFIETCSSWPRGYLNDHFQPQSILLKRALKDRRFRIYKCENLASDWLDICNQIETRCGIRPEDLRRENVSTRVPIQVTERALKLASQFYRQDFQTFGYGFSN